MIVSVLFLCRFTRVAACLFQVREFLGKLDELVGKVSYANDPIKLKKPALQQRTDKLLHDLIKRSPVFGCTCDPLLLLGAGLINDLLFFMLFPLSSFVVETQPSMPQGKGPLVLRTNVQFSVKTRLVRNSWLQDSSEGITETKTTMVFGYQFRFKFWTFNIKIKNRILINKPLEIWF